VRYASTSRTRQLKEYRLLEREQLARELHDTVAHHVSAIAIQAQAAQAVAGTRPEAAASALRTIETEATRALSEMRMMVGALRDGGAPDLTPQRGIADLDLLARPSADTPQVRVTVTGDLTNLSPALNAAVFRLAQESVTNALRHARHARRVDVTLIADDATVRLRVADDGDQVPVGRSERGYGVVGMAERVALLEGTFDAGPGHDGGWTVSAVLPRTENG
jgi:signal transduction histidine kinase